MGVESKRVCSCEERARPNKNNIKMGRGGQEVLKMDDILASKALPLGKSQMQRQAMVREYVAKLAMILLEHISNHGFCVVDNFLGGQAGSLLLEEVSAPNPGEGDCRGIRYLCNLLDSVVTLAARKAKENGQKNILSEITGRDLGMQIGNPVPEASNQTNSLTATIFLNKDWQVDSDGGELRLSPSAPPSESTCQSLLRKMVAVRLLVWLLASGTGFPICMPKSLPVISDRIFFCPFSFAFRAARVTTESRRLQRYRIPLQSP